jgi:hypothetical protein
MLLNTIIRRVVVEHTTVNLKVGIRTLPYRKKRVLYLELSLPEMIRAKS